MGFFDRLFGNPPPAPAPASVRQHSSGASASPPSADAQALERYRYMLQTAPPETLEQAHEEAFAKLTPQQRSQLLGELTRIAPPNERAAIEATSSEDPRGLARIATRAEVRQPGVLERTMGGGGMGFGSSLLSSFAAGFVGSMVAQSFFSAMGGGWGADSAADESSTADNDQVSDEAADYGSGDDGGGDFDV